MLRNHSIILSLIDFKKRLSRTDTDERFYLSTAQDEVKKNHKSSMRKVGTARYGYIDSFGKFEHESTLVLSQISCTASGLALLEGKQKFKLEGCVGAHKMLISCTNMMSKYIK
jgi:hypothetical protein